MKFEEIEEIMEAYFRCSSKDACAKENDVVARYNRQVIEFNEWQDCEAGRIKEPQLEVEQLGLEIDSVDSQIAKQNLVGPAIVEIRNKLISERNALVNRYNAKVNSISVEVDAHNGARKQRSKELEAFTLEVDQATQEAREIHDRLSAWQEHGSDLIFFRELNQDYAAAQTCSAAARLRTYRRELGEWAWKQEQEKEHGVQIVEATLCGAEPFWVVVDTGANSVTIPRFLVRRLDLEGQEGESVQCVLAGGVRVEGRRITIPEITALGKTVTDVDAIILAESGAGVDGLLGMSFLRRIEET